MIKLNFYKDFLFDSFVSLPSLGMEGLGEGEEQR
jgi:hypothetical protein